MIALQMLIEARPNTEDVRDALLDLAERRTPLDARVLDRGCVDSMLRGADRATANAPDEAESRSLRLSAGAMVGETLAATDLLASEDGVDASVIVANSPELLVGALGRAT